MLRFIKHLRVDLKLKNRKLYMTCLVTGAANYVFLFSFIALIDSVHCICPSECPASVVDTSHHGPRLLCTIEENHCEIPSVSEDCSQHVIPVGDHGFTVKSIRILDIEEEKFLQMDLEIPSLTYEDVSGLSISLFEDPNTTWVVKLTLDYDRCMTLTFPSKSLNEHKRNITIPCAKVSSGPIHELSYTLYVKHQNFVHLLHSQKVRILNPEGSVKIPFFSILNFTTFITERLLHFAFDASPLINFSYNISVHAAGNQRYGHKSNPLGLYEALPIQTWLQKKGTKEITSNLDGYEACKTYSFKFTPAHTELDCEKNCNIYLEEVFYFHSPALLKNCSTWNASITAMDYSIDKEMKVFFRKCCGYEHCWKNFGLYLARLSPTWNTCTKIHDIQYSSMVENVFPLSVIWHVKNLRPGNYCAKVKPRSCNECHLLNSNIATIRRSSEFHTNAQPTETTAPHEKAATIASSVVAVFLVFVLFISGYFYWRRTKRQFIPPEIEPEIGLLQKNTNSDVSAFFWHTFDAPTKQRVKELLSVLRQGTSTFVESIGESSDAVQVEGTLFLTSRVQFGTTQNEDGRRIVKKIVVVQSKRAVAYQKYQKANESQDNGLPNPFTNKDGIEMKDAILDISFPSVLKDILEKKPVTDYFHVLVVHFTENTPRELQLEGFPHVRYYLPDDIVKFCTVLEADTPKEHNVLSKPEELKSAMQQNHTYQPFVHTIADYS